MAHYKRVIAAAVATLTLGVGAAALPSVAEAKVHRGTITRTEAGKVYKQMLRQKCLTVKETRKIVHGKGYLYEEEGYWGLYYDGKGRVEYADIQFTSRRGCAFFIDTHMR